MEANALMRAETLAEVGQAVNFGIPVGPDHPFFTDFSDVRGKFEEKALYQGLNVSRDRVYDDQLQVVNKSLVFLGGMRGSGKTTELRKIAGKLEGPKCFLVITCDVDKGLNMNNIEYVDILMFQMERLIERADEIGLKVSESVLGKFQAWMSERVKEVESKSGYGMGVEAGVSGETPSWLTLLSIFGAFKANLTASSTSTDTVRQVLKRRFDNLADEVNLFLGEVVLELRLREMARDVLFVIDGIEKTMTAEQRRKVIIDEANYIQQIKANAIFTLPIELLKERPRLKQFSTSVLSFPFVKLYELDNSRIEPAFARFREFVDKRVNSSLFDSPDTIDRAIEMSGGSPRELLRIILQASWATEDDATLIDRKAMEKGIDKLANEDAQYIDAQYWDKIYDIERKNRSGLATQYDAAVEYLLEKMAVMEYNDGTYLRVSPLVARSKLYQDYLPDDLR